MIEKRRGCGEGVADDIERTGLKKQPSERNFERYTKSLIEKNITSQKCISNWHSL